MILPIRALQFFHIQDAAQRPKPYAATEYATATATTAAEHWWKSV